LSNANQNVGGQRITLGEQSFNVRGVGLIKSLRDIGNVVVAETKGVPVRVQDIARVLVGYAPRLGIVGKDLEPDIVQGVVLMRYGGDSLKTIEGVHERVDYIRRNRLLPPHGHQPYYDRAALVELDHATRSREPSSACCRTEYHRGCSRPRARRDPAVNIPMALIWLVGGDTGTQANRSHSAKSTGIVVGST
jgi:cobalt-zinc-cadmium resistance protein CzcA